MTMPKGFYSGKNILVTGITGMVGSWLAERLLKEGASVIGIIRDENPNSNFYQLGLEKMVTCVHGDISDITMLERVVIEYDCNLVFHLAGQSTLISPQRSPLSAFESNIRGTWNILEVVRRIMSLEGMVLVSSGRVYDASAPVPFSEATPLMGKTPFIVSKVAADMLAQSYHQAYQLPIAIARCAEVYGCGDTNFQRLIPSTIRAILQGENPLVRSDGAATREYIYIDDVVEGLVRLGSQIRSQQLEGETFNITSGQAMTDLEVVEKLLNKMNHTDLRPIILCQNYDEAPKIILDSEKAANLLGFNPRFTLDETIAQVITWYDNYLHRQSISQ